MATQAEAPPRPNGVDVEQLVRTVAAIRAQPDLARFTFRAHTEWQDGGHSRTTIQRFFGAGTEDTSRPTPFVLDGDEPPVLLGANHGPNAVEVVLHALASCLAVGFVYNAAARGIRVESLDFDVQGDLDLHGFLGLADSVRPGYQGVTVTYRATTDAPRDKVEALCEYVQKTSPVLDILRNPVAVRVVLADSMERPLESDATLDLGAAGCGDMTPLIRGRMRELTSGQVLEVLSEEPAAHEGIPAWSRLTGNQLIRVERSETGSRFYIRKK